MRMQVASALCVVLLSTCSPRPAAAQLNPANTKPIQSFSAKPLADAKFSAGLQNAELAAAAPASKLRDELAQRARRALLDRLQEKAATEPVPCAQCAHILVWKAPNIDPKMILDLPQDYSSPMPIVHGLSPCPDDFRGVLMLPQAPPQVPMPLFIGPPRLRPLFLDPHKSSHPDHP
jgi:hypothetical protein